MATLTRQICEDLGRFAAEFLVLRSAVSDYVAGKTSAINYNHASVKTLLGSTRNLLQAMVDLNDSGLEDFIHDIRTKQRWIARLAAAPEVFSNTFANRVNELSTDGHTQFKSYTVRAGDTPQSIAQNEMGDAGRWLEITDLNGLSYPYVSDDPTATGNIKATGSILVQNISTLAADYVLPAGTIIGTDDDSPVEFVTTADVTLPTGAAGVTGVSVAVQCLLAGPIGNIGPGRIKRITFSGGTKNSYTYTLAVTVADRAGNQTTKSQQFQYTVWPRVSNPGAFTGGALGKIATVGQKIFLPIPASAGSSLLTRQDELNASDSVYGTDLYLDEDGRLAANQRGDVLLSSGLDNLAIALRVRLLTERGDLAFHGLYGSRLYQMLGKLNTPYLRDRVVVEIRDVGKSDPRINDVQVSDVTLSDDRIEARVDYITKTSRDTAALKLIASNL